MAPKIYWRTVVDVKSDILFMSLNSLGLKRKYIKKALDIDYEYKTLYHFDNTVAYSKEDLDNFFILVKEKLTKEKNYFFKFPNKVYRLAKNLLSFSKKIQSINNFQNYTNSKLLKVFDSYWEKAASTFPLLVIIIPIEVIIVGELEKFVRQKLKEQNKLNYFDEYFQALTQRSTKKTYFQDDYVNLLRIGQEIQKSKALTDLFQKNTKVIINNLKARKAPLYQKLLIHNSQYSWINMYCFRRQPFTLDELVERIKDILQKDCKNELINLKVKSKKTEKIFKKAIKELEIKGKLKRQVETLSEYVYLRTYRLDIFTLSAYLVRNLLKEIGSRFGLSYDELIYLTFWEIKDLLSGKVKVGQIPIKQRMKNYAAIQINGKFEVVIDPIKLKKLYEEKRKIREKKVKIFKGMVACQGRVKGIVSIVMHPTQIVKVKKGDILVAPMTSPDFVVGMLKAAAIITDHGGVTCHAAIVSRELGLPCIVGTQIATKVLKDGDLVEVDANKGIITILED